MGKKRAKTAKERYEAWYARNSTALSEKRRALYESDPDYRDRVLEQSRSYRGRLREKKAEGRFKKRLVTYKKKHGKNSKRRPRRFLIDGRKEWVYSTAELAARVGRVQTTLRSWLAEGVLPGASVIISGRYHFTKEFMDAVERACRRLPHIHGAGRRDVLGKLIREEILYGRVSWVPRGGTEADRRKSSGEV